MTIKRDPADDKENHSLYAWVFQNQWAAFLTLLSSVSSVCLSTTKKLNLTLRNQTDHTSMPGARNWIPLTRKYTSPTTLPSWCVPCLAGSWDCLLSMLMMEKGMAIHSSILAWRVPWTEEPGGLQSRGRKESDTTEQTDTLMHLNKELSKSGDKCLSNQIWVKFPQSTLITEVAFSESYHLMKGQALGSAKTFSGTGIKAQGEDLTLSS